MPQLTLASGSAIRATLLRNAGLDIEVSAPRIDEDAVKAALLAEDAAPRDIADALAEAKARRVAARVSGLVVGCDQVLDEGGRILSKPLTPDAAKSQLKALRGKRHMLLSAAVLYEDGHAVWRHVGQVRLQMRMVSDDYIDAYVARNWESIRESVGSYKLEEEGVRLMERVDGDYFSVLGIPLLELLSYLTLRGTLPA